MPLAGSLDIRSLLEDAPSVTLSDRELRVDNVEILQVLYEIPAIDIEGLVPPALNPTIPPVVSFLAYHAADSEFGPFSLVQARVSPPALQFDRGRTSCLRDATIPTPPTRCRARGDSGSGPAKSA